jgi:DNA-binding ferritin-like protein
MDLENYCVCKQRYMNEKLEKLLKELKAYRNDMVARNYPFQQISNIITKWEMKELPGKDFLDEAEKEKKELEDSYQESMRQTKERKQLTKKEKDDTTTTI